MSGNVRTVNGGETVGSFLRQARKTAGLTQNEVGETLGVSGAAVSTWERDESPIPRWAIDKLEKLLKLKKGELAGRAGYAVSQYDVRLAQVEKELRRQADALAELGRLVRELLGD